MLHKLEILTVITSSQEEVFKKGCTFLPGEHVSNALNAVLCEDGEVVCFLRSTERSGMIIAKKSPLDGLWRLSFNGTDSKVSVSQMMYGMHDISKINNWEEVIKGMNSEDLFD